jgi:hypothetical protein
MMLNHLIFLPSAPNFNFIHLHRVDKNEDGRITEEEVKEVKSGLLLLELEYLTFVFLLIWV